MSHPFIVQIDHVGIYTEQPEALFRFFTQDLHLPVAFPFVTYPAYTTGSVALGNCFLEITKLGSPPTPSSPPFAARYQILGFFVRRALLQSSPHELARQQIAHSGVVPFFAPEATDADPLVMWENVYLGNLLGANIWQRLFLALTRRSPAKPSTQRSPLMQRLAAPLLLRAFRHGMPVLTAYHMHIDEHARAISRETLRAHHDRLGIEAVSSVAVSAPAADEWIKLLGAPAIDDQFVWQLGDGPALRLTLNQAPKIVAIVLQVTSLALARDQLTKLSVQIAASDGGLAFTVPQTRGLQIQLTEAVKP